MAYSSTEAISFLLKRNAGRIYKSLKNAIFGLGTTAKQHPWMLRDTLDDRINHDMSWMFQPRQGKTVLCKGT